jgi:hypothetical protein
MKPFLRWLLVALVFHAIAPSAMAMITGGTGNEPLPDPGWPAGADKVFNHPSRVACWEGPPFGGGQSHAECRGDAKTFNAVLADFAQIDAKVKRVVLHDGVGASFWLNPNNELEKRVAARIDWTFIVWQPASWTLQQSLSADARPTDLGDPQLGPPVQLDVYTGVNLRWQDVHVPPGVEIVDKRLEAHGFKLDDGLVLEGRLRDSQSQQPVAANVRLERVKPQRKGGYSYTTTLEANCDASGHWQRKNVPAGWFRVVASAPGYVPRVLGHVQVNDQPGWREFNSELSHPGPVSGQVVDREGKPLSDATVTLRSVTAANDTEYDSPDDYKTQTDADGKFQLEMVPVGTARITAYKDGLVRRGLGQPIEMPSSDLKLSMTPAAQLVVKVSFEDDRPPNYIVNLEPEGGNKVGSWGGSAHIDDQNQVTFRNVPPGKYTLRGHPNPTSEAEVTAPVEVDLRGDEAKSIDLRAR